MTQTIERIDTSIDWEQLAKEFHDDAVGCTVMHYNFISHNWEHCPREADFDVLVTCPNDHERVSHYCTPCCEIVQAGRTDCLICKDVLLLRGCKVRALAVYPRGK